MKNDHQEETRRIMAEQAATRQRMREEGHGCHDCAYRLNNRRMNRGGMRCITCFTCQEYDHWTAPNAEAESSAGSEE